MERDTVSIISTRVIDHKYRDLTTINLTDKMNRETNFSTKSKEIQRYSYTYVQLLDICFYHYSQSNL